MVERRGITRVTLPKKHERERIFQSLWLQCVKETCTEDMLDTFDNHCGTHLQTDCTPHEHQAFYEFIRDEIFPKWVNVLINRETI